MPKSSFTDEAAIVRTLLRTLRERAALTQADVAKALDVPQSYVSKYEIGERRLDFAEIHAACAALGVSIVDFAKEFSRLTRKGVRNER
jgi:transcriptional regulator with XRE-family HTH domain